MKNIFCILFLLPSLLFAQQNLPLNREWGLSNERSFSLIDDVEDTTASLNNKTEKNDKI